MMSLSPFLLVAVFVVSASGGGYDGSICEGYAKCVKMEFSVNRDTAANCGGSCDVKACMIRVECDWKDDEISHVCSNIDDCASHADMNAVVLEKNNLNYKKEKFLVDDEICATGKPGEFVHFAVKDQTLICDGTGQEVTFGNSKVTGNCYKWSVAYGSCSGQTEGANSDATCAYAVKLPDICGGSGSSGGSGGSGETEGCCLDTVAPTCKFVADSYPGSMTVDFPDSDAQGLADRVFKDYECEKPVDSCNVMYCKKHIPAEVFTQYGGTVCGDVV